MSGVAAGRSPARSLFGVGATVAGRSPARPRLDGRTAAGRRGPGAGGRRSRRLAGADGQSAVEIVGLLPILLAVTLAAAQLLAAGVANEVADHAAEAGALAILQGGDPADAARAAVPGWARERVDVAVSATRVAVTVRPPSPFPGLADRLTAHASAHAGGGS